MKSFRRLFPSFEKPVERSRYVNIEPETYEFRGIGTVLLLAATCGVAFALWEPSHQVTSPFVASAARPAPPAKIASKEPAAKVAGRAANASTDAEDDEQTLTVGLSNLCSQRATARRDCASAKALREARLNAPPPAKETQPPAIMATKPAAVATKNKNTAKKQQPEVAVNAVKQQPEATVKQAEVAVKQPEAAVKQSETTVKPGDIATQQREATVKQAEVAVKQPEAAPKQAEIVATAARAEGAATAAQTESAPTAARVESVTTTGAVESAATSARAETVPAAAAQPDPPAARPQRTASAPKAKRQRQQAPAAASSDDGPVERLVRVYDQVLPDGRRVPVYRRVGSGRYETGTIVDGEYRANRRANLDSPSGRYFGLQ